MSGKGRQIFKEYFEAFAVALLAALLLRMLVIQAFRIPTGSMKDTLLVGDFLLVNKFVYGANTPDRIPFTDIKIPSLHMPAIHQPKRSDIIVFKYPQDEKLDYIKRCIGVPGDTVMMRKGVVYVNNKPEGETKFIERRFDESEGRYINYFRVRTADQKEYTIRRYEGFAYDFGPVVVPGKHLFMMGDNRDNSQDSRYWGFMPMKNIRGQALVIYWSWEKNGTFLDHVRWSRIFGIIR
jgi:signal peptidase I